MDLQSSNNGSVNDDDGSLSPLPQLSEEILQLIDSQVVVEEQLSTSTSNQQQANESLKREIVAAVEQAVKKQLDAFKEDLLARLTPHFVSTPVKTTMDTPVSLPHNEEESDDEPRQSKRRHSSICDESARKKAVVISSDEEEDDKKKKDADDSDKDNSVSELSSVGEWSEDKDSVGYGTSDFVVSDDDDPYQPRSGADRKKKRALLKKSQQKLQQEKEQVSPVRRASGSRMALRSQNSIWTPHTDKFYTCEVCGSTFTESVAFYKHKRTHGRSFVRG